MRSNRRPTLSALWAGIALSLCLVPFASPVAAARLDAPHRAKLAPDLRATLDAERAAHPASSLSAPVHRVVVTLIPLASRDVTPRAFETPAAERTLRDNVSRAQERVLEALDRRPGTESFRLLARYESIYGFSAEADADAIERLAAHPRVASIHAMPVYTRSDVQAHALADVDRAHGQDYRGRGTTLAVIDDGIDHDHAAFGGQAAWPNDKILGGTDTADWDDDPRIDCPNQTHGTAVSGVAAGDGGGVLGSAPEANLVMIKIQSAALCNTLSFDGDVSAAIDWAVTNRDAFDPPIRVISMSFGYNQTWTSGYGSPCGSIAEDAALTAAANAGLALFAASGNDAFSTGMSAPACHPDVWSVGAVYDADIGARFWNPCSDPSTAADQITCYSNSDTFLDFLAPSNCAVTAATGGGTDNCFGGTSSATPYIAGVAALLYEKNHRLSRSGVDYALTYGGRAITDPRNGVTARRVDADNALSRVTPFTLKIPNPKVNGVLVGARGTYVSGGTLWPLSTPEETATRLCQDRGMPRHSSLVRDLRGSTYTFVNGQDGNGPWGVTGNSNVDMLDRIDCRLPSGSTVTNYSPPRSSGVQVGHWTGSSISREEIAKQFCALQGHETGYSGFSYGYPVSTTYSSWSGSSWFVSGNSNVELFSGISCIDLP